MSVVLTTSKFTSHLEGEKKLKFEIVSFGVLVDVVENNLSIH